jgi:hypothetical protein
MFDMPLLKSRFIVAKKSMVVCLTHPRLLLRVSILQNRETKRLAAGAYRLPDLNSIH